MTTADKQEAFETALECVSREAQKISVLMGDIEDFISQMVYAGDRRDLEKIKALVFFEGMQADVRCMLIDDCLDRIREFTSEVLKNGDITTSDATDKTEDGSGGG